jgi:hypothetical protein
LVINGGLISNNGVRAVATVGLDAGTLEIDVLMTERYWRDEVIPARRSAVDG